MITLNNFREVLLSLGFTADERQNVYTKYYHLNGGVISDVIMSVNFAEKQLEFPADMRGGDRNTLLDDAHKENMVVFECVDRLLEKGYKVEDIELEKVWQLGRDGKSGRADVCVNEAGNPEKMLLIIECKTAGKEYEGAIKNTEEDGAQVFSYWQQERATQWLAVYASGWNPEEQKVTHKCSVINCSDDKNLLEVADRKRKKKEDVSEKLYRDAQTTKQLFDVWQETYNSEWHDDIIFKPHSQAYKIGVDALRKRDLVPFSMENSKIVNKFEEILRHNNVSDKENAFNRLIALFICKLVDETKKGENDEMEFQYKERIDTYEDLQDRLQRLHKEGMDEFMKEDIYYVEKDFAHKLFKSYKGASRAQAIKQLDETIRNLKFYSNNDFAFVDVHNEELFAKNGKILVEVVKLFQTYRIVYPEKNQFLGDLFEQLLNKGFKQNEGQFFTPTPLTRFVWDCFPLERYLSEHGLPKVIDYACGAGHFLTEGIEAINDMQHKRRNSEKHMDNKWVRDCFYGIEKDYRLARVSKIALFMNGAGDANIIFGDGLDNDPSKGVENGRFDILVANPPYSVSSFKAHLKLQHNDLELLPRLTINSGEIETLFVERIGQLLKSGGLAGVFLPSSILSNNSQSYIGAREQILSNFYLRAITCFGNKTFGATTTNTVVLFMERFQEPPVLKQLAIDTAHSILAGNLSDEWDDKDILNDYLSTIGVTQEQYINFINEEASINDLRAIEYFKTYVDEFEKTKQTYPKKYTPEQIEQERKDRLYKKIREIEKDKLIYFTLVRGQETVVITAPSDNAEQKNFLGYDWSNRKGSEGIMLNPNGGCLTDNNNRFAHGTLASIVRNAFNDSQTILGEDSKLQKYVANYRTVDMLDFSKADFDKGIKTKTKSAVKIISKYPLYRLGAKDEGGQPLIATIFAGISAPQDERVFENGIIPFFRVSDVSKYHLSKNLTEVNDYVTADFAKGKRMFPKGTILFPKSGASTYLDHRAIMGTDGLIVSHLAGIIVNTKNALIEYIYEVLTQIKARDIKEDSGYPSVNASDLEDLQIPLPPIEIQQKLVSECQIVDKEYNNSRMSIEEYRNKIAQVFENLQVITSGGGKSVKLREICQYRLERTTIVNPNLYITTDNMLQHMEGIKDYEGTPNIPSAIIYKSGDILVSNIRPYLQKIWYADRDGSCSPDVLVFQKKDESIDSKFLFYSMRRPAFFEYIMNQAGVSGVKMPRGNKDATMNFEIQVPSLADQQRIIAEVEQYEAKIKEAQNIMESCAVRKKAILDKCLN